MEAEYFAISEAAKEAVWLRKSLADLEVILDIDKLLILYCDNSGAMTNSKEHRSHKRGKHIKRKYHLIREIVHWGNVAVLKIAYERNLVDSFTKTLPVKSFEGYLGWGICPICFKASERLLGIVLYKKCDIIFFYCCK